MARIAGLRLRDRWARMAARAVHGREPVARLGLRTALIEAEREQATAQDIGGNMVAEGDERDRNAHGPRERGWAGPAPGPREHCCKDERADGVPARERLAQPGYAEVKAARASASGPPRLHRPRATRHSAATAAARCPRRTRTSAHSPTVERRDERRRGIGPERRRASRRRSTASRGRTLRARRRAGGSPNRAPRHQVLDRRSGRRR